ncbi:MAG: RNA 2',3'-cyclic phosphodiesterase [Vicinamibacterales bacterium]
MAAALRRELERWPSPPRVTWVRPDLMHLTLRFLGEVGDALAGQVRAALEAPLDVEAFEAGLGPCATLPPRRPPRVIHRDVPVGRPPLGEVKALVDRRLEALVGPAERRPFHPHLTLGRVRAPGVGPWARALAIAADGTPAVTWRVDHVTLFRSELGPDGPSYTPIVVTPLEQDR